MVLRHCYGALQFFFGKAHAGIYDALIQIGFYDFLIFLKGVYKFAKTIFEWWILNFDEMAQLFVEMVHFLAEMVKLLAEKVIFWPTRSIYYFGSNWSFRPKKKRAVKWLYTLQTNYITTAFVNMKIWIKKCHISQVTRNPYIYSVYIYVRQ